MIMGGHDPSTLIDPTEPLAQRPVQFDPFLGCAADFSRVSFCVPSDDDLYALEDDSSDEEEAKGRADDPGYLAKPAVGVEEEDAAADGDKKTVKGDEVENET